MVTKTTVKRIMMFMNILIFLAGAVVFVAGLLIRVQSGLVDPDVVTLFNQVEYNNVKVGTALNVTDFLMIIAGGVLLLLALFGLCAAWKKIKCCLLVYVLIVLLMILIQAAAVGVMLSVRGRTEEWLKGRLLDLIGNYAGPDATDDTSKGWNAMFVEAQCCSVNAYTTTTNDFDTSTWWTMAIRGIAIIPSSCCQGDISDTTSAYVVSCTDTPNNYYTEGCYSVIRYYVNTYSMVLAAAAAVLLIVEVVAIVCSCVLLDKMKNRVEHTRGLDNANHGGPPQNVAYVDTIGKPSYKRF